MKIKYIILFFISFLLCGCSVKYELEVNDYHVNEKIIFKSLSDKDFKKLDAMKDTYSKYYSITINKFTKTVVARRSSINFDTFLKNSIGRQYFILGINNDKNNKNVSINARTDRNTLLSYYYIFNPEDDVDLVTPSGDTSDFNLDVKIICNNKTLSSNADKTFGRNYYWNFKDSNLDKTISFQYNPTITLFDWTMVYISGFIILVASIIVFILKNKSKKVNEIS